MIVKEYDTSELLLQAENARFAELLDSDGVAGIFERLGRQLDPAGWEAGIDCFDGEKITGWAKGESPDAAGEIDLYINDRLVCPNLSASGQANDPEKEGMNSFAFEFRLYPVDLEAPLFCINIRHGDKILALTSCEISANSRPEFLSRLMRQAARRALWPLYFHCAKILASLERLSPEEIKKIMETAKSQKEFLVADYFARGLKNAPGYETDYCEAPLEISSLDFVIPLRAALLRCMNIAASGRKLAAGFYNRYMGVFNLLKGCDKSPITSALYNNYVRHYLKAPSDLASNPNITNIARNKILIFVEYLRAISWIRPILSFLPPEFAEICALNKTAVDEGIVRDWGLGKYRIHYGAESLAGFKTFIVEQHVPQIKEIYEKIKHGKIISWNHSSDNDFWNFPESHLFIANSENQIGLNILRPNRIMCDGLAADNLESIKDLDYRRKCELAYTGLWRIAKYLEQRQDTAMWRKRLEEKLGISLPPSRPVICCMEDEFTPQNQMTWMLNRLAKRCVVIFKRAPGRDPSILKKLSPEIIIYKDESFAPNLIKFGVDFTLCGLLSGTLATCILLGLPALTYYSPIYRFYDDSLRLLADTPHIKASPRYYYAGNLLVANWPWPFKCTDVKAMEKAIFEPEYLEKYFKELPRLRKLCFGDYCIEDAAEKTAAYILRFAAEGTIGKDAYAVMLKDFYNHKWTDA